MPDSDRVRWNSKWEARGPASADDPDPWLRVLRDELTAGARTLDLACGAGRQALWLASEGFAVTAVDVSEVALGLLRQSAQALGLEVETQALDLAEEPLPPGPWDLVTLLHYLDRALFPRLPALLAPGGLFVFVQPTRLNLTRHKHPSERFLLEEGELPRLLGDLEVLRSEEGWNRSGRHEARVLARRPG